MDQKKVSVVIPNYNGLALLKKNLRGVLEVEDVSEIVVVDDGSTDGSVTYLRKQGRIRVIALSKNRGFSSAVNQGVKKVRGDLVVLLNTDVWPRKDVVKFVAPYFADSNLFAVGLGDYSHEGEKIIVRGRAAGDFRKGLLIHWAAKPIFGETLWASGGAAVFDREKWLKLGGFDEAYNPFYWEDIDLSYRAWKAGYRVFFEPKARVDHYHEEGAIKRNYSPARIEKIAFRNQLIFVWKNITSTKFVLLHLFWLPWHLAKALLSLRWSFILGFAEALPRLPKTIFVKRIDFKLGDEDIMENFKSLDRSE